MQLGKSCVRKSFFWIWLVYAQKMTCLQVAFENDLSTHKNDLCASHIRKAFLVTYPATSSFCDTIVTCPLLTCLRKKKDLSTPQNPTANKSYLAIANKPNFVDERRRLFSCAGKSNFDLPTQFFSRLHKSFSCVGKLYLRRKKLTCVRKKMTC